MNTDKLTPRQARFVENYLLDLNASAAAARAGYSRKTARSIGQRLLTNVYIEVAIGGNLQIKPAAVRVTPTPGNRCHGTG